MEKKSQPISANTSWRGHGTILLVDDEESVCMVTSRMLKFLGFSVLVANDGQQGVDLFRVHQEKITAVILDLTMPRLNGEKAFQEIRRIKSDVRVLLFSGYTEQEATERFAGKGLFGFLQKPFHPDELIAKMRTLTEK
ncbi:MAG: response regulator [Verrucomicrobiota bacterium]